MIQGSDHVENMNIVSFSDSFDLKDGSIRSSAVYNGRLYVGLNDGHLNVYDMNTTTDDDDNDHHAEYKLQKRTKLVEGAIDKIGILPDMDYAIVLSDRVIYIYTLRDLQLEEKLDNYKNANTFQIYSSAIEISNQGNDQLLDDSYIEKNSMVDYGDSMSLATASTANLFDSSQSHSHHHHHAHDLFLDHQDEPKVRDYRSYIAISYKRKLVVYCFIKDEFNSKSEYNLSDKSKCMEFLSSEKLLVCLNNNDIALVDLYNTEEAAQNAITQVDSLPYISSSVVSSSSSFNYFRSHSPKYFVVRALPNTHIISKESVAVKLTDNAEMIHYKKKSSKKNPLHWSKPPQFLLYWFPYLVLAYDNQTIELRKVRNGEIQQTIHIEGRIRDLNYKDDKLIVFTDKTVEIWERLAFKDILRKARDSSKFEDAISLIEKLQPSVCEAQFADFLQTTSPSSPLENDQVTATTDKEKKFLLLREFQIKYAIQLFEQGQVDRAVDLLISFMAPPDIVLPLLPNLDEQLSQMHIMVNHDDSRSVDNQSVMSSSSSPTKNHNGHISSSSPLKSKKSFNHSHDRKNAHSMKVIISLIPYLTDARRKITKMLNPESPHFEWKGVTFSKQIYLVSAKDDDKDTLRLSTLQQRSLDDLIKLVDNTLLKCYLITSPRLVGPLLRVNNYCDPDTVEETLKRQNMLKELIDYYYSQKLHERALQLLQDLAQSHTTALSGPLPTVQYLQKLDNENLELIFKYIKAPMGSDKEYCLEVFNNDSIESESLNRFETLKFLESENCDAKIIEAYLRHLIYDLNDATTKFHNKFMEILIAKDDFVGLKTFLNESNHYNFNQADSILDSAIAENDDEKNEKEYLTCKTIVLSKMKQHEKVLDIYVYRLKDYQSALTYCLQIYTENDGEQEGIRLLHVLLEKYLSTPETRTEALDLLASQGLKLQLEQVLEKLDPELSVASLQKFLITSYKQDEINSKQVNLLRNLTTLRQSKLKEKLLHAKSDHVVIDEESTCKVCHKRLGYSVLSWYSDSTVVHYGCSKKNLS